MKIQFIAQGIPESKSVPVGDTINSALTQTAYNSFAAFVAFVSVDGINQLKDSFTKFVNNGGCIRLYIGVDLHGTSKDALQLLLSLEGIQCYVVYSTNRIVYHPKIYSFEGKNTNMLIVGSSNMTLSGLYQNMEASICISCENNEEDRSVISDIYDYYNTILSNESAYCQPLTQEIIDILYKNKVVLTSEETRAQTNEQNKKNQTAINDQEELKKTFSSVKIPPSKVVHRKTFIENVYTEKDVNRDTSIYFQSVQIERNSMWIETKDMTGGSRNILDLSKKGVSNGVTKPGSVEFFGIDKDNYTIEKDIELDYNGKIYKGNTIKYADGNSNWRLQIKGEADDGSKITYLSNPKLGIPGGLTQKILVFEKTTEQDRYKLHIHDEEYIDQFKSISIEWATMGNTNGRAYGYIN